MLKNYFPYEYADSIYSIDYKKLYKKGFRALLFDLDNTLVHHGDDSTPKVDKFFADLHKMGFRTILISDNDRERVERFNKNIGTRYICDAGKPSPKPYKKALDILGVKPEEALVLGDQIFKDILGANRAGIPSIMVKFIRLEGETHFGKRRAVENIILKVYYLTRVYTHRLGKILK